LNSRPVTPLVSCKNDFPEFDEYERCAIITGTRKTASFVKRVFMEPNYGGGRCFDELLSGTLYTARLFTVVVGFKQKLVR